jgi:hypothetical protein
LESAQETVGTEGHKKAKKASLQIPEEAEEEEK